ncbi:peptidase M16-like protein [Flavobacterium cauense R2A-7]|uniref:Putative Zn-dependent peptidase n=1 Tax=Flavobacterium cauense R2A-7 TaxID=1341154 RepID=V6S142_9FLAO|nr:pitrilysin family protein [Flavobacterium cauense]ESU19987.1 peptidase M16-like protein [Flavobacterium cauense R2A-7]KGO83792.1 peptidase M16 [Flavobacterium cauense R2A-7]TWI12412.1 putative Zn-dependent peptidase [Flavobacterium cauense R2A-7]
MKKYIYIAASLFLTITMQAQDRTQPKPGPSPTINVGKPSSFVLKNGLKVLVVENHKLPRVSFNLTIDNAPYAEGDKKGVADLTSALIGNGTKNISKDAFNEEIDFLGANINFNANGASASGLSKYAGRIMELMADGALNPVFTQAELDKEREKLLEGLKSNEKSVTAVAQRVEDVLAFGKNHPNGEYLSEATIKNVTLNDVILNYNTYFVPGNAYLVIVGDVKLKDVQKMVEKQFGPWKKAVAPALTYTDPKNVQYSQINFIDMPNAVQSEIALVNTVNLKMTDKEYFAGILANQILGGGGEGRLFLNLREKHGWTYGAYSSLGSGKYVEKFRSGASVRNAVTDSAVVEFMNELRRIRTELVSAEDLKNAKAKYIGNFVMQIQKPATIARYALNTETQGLPADFYENYIKNINAVTAEDIKAAANKYFLAENTRVVIVGKASEVLPNLEKMSAKQKLPIMYFDKFGNPTEKPKVSIPIPAGVTAKTVFNNYINAIGGEKAVKAVKSVVTVSSGTVQGTPVELTTKTTADNKMAVEMKAMGMSMMKQVIGDKSGYRVAQGQRKDLTAEELKEQKASAVPFEELTLANNASAKLEAIETMNGNDVYVIKEGKTTYYYDVKTGLKAAESKEMEQMGQKMTQTTYYSDYKEVKGIKFPHTTDMNVGIEIKLMTTEVKINEGVVAEDFK